MPELVALEALGPKNGAKIFQKRRVGSDNKLLGGPLQRPLFCHDIWGISEVRVIRARWVFLGGCNIVTQLVDRALQGDSAAFESLRVAVYQLIMDVTPHRLRAERKGHTFQVTALANEIWKKLDERQMLDVLARRTTPATKALIGAMIRNFLVDYARRRLARFRAEGRHQLELADFDIQLDLSTFAPGAGSVAVAVFVDALEKLAQLDPEAAEVFSQRVFACLKSQEIAEMLNRSVRAVQLAYKRAQVILAREIERTLPT